MLNWLARFAMFTVLLLGLAAFVLFVRYPDLAFRFASERVASYREKVAGELAVKDSTPWFPVGRGVERRIVTATRAGSYPIELYGLRLDPSMVIIEVVVLSASEIGANPIGVLAEKTGALVMMNGSFFNEELGILGLCISSGREVSPLVKAGDHRGVFFRRGEVAGLVERERFSPAGVESAIQSGPWLVKDGAAQDDFGDKDRVTRRSSVAVDGAGHVVFVVTDTVVSGITLKHLAQVLAMPVDRGGFGAVNALNLDGGTSSQLILRTPTDSHLIRGFVNVPVLLGVYPRID